LAENAGLEPGRLNPLVVEVMKETGMDISGNSTKGVWDIYKQGKTYHFVITVCYPETEQLCPINPGITRRISWPFDDPPSFTGSVDEKLTRTREVRDHIKMRIEEFVQPFDQESF